MNVLLVSHCYPPFGLAGVERVTERTALELTDAGHRVTVLSRRPTPAPMLPRIERANQNGVDVITISGGGTLPEGPFPGHQDRLERIFERLLLELLPDVVVIAHLMRHSPGYVSTAHRWQIPVVLELHDFYTICERAHLERPSGDLCRGPEGGRACAQHCFAGERRAAGRWALRTHLFDMAVTQADALICPSEFVADYFHELGLTRARIQVVPNGIAIDALPPESDAARRSEHGERPLHLASLGVVSPHKGAHFVVQALKKAGLPAVRYTLFGGLTQPYTHQLRELADRVEGLELRTYGAYESSSLPSLLTDVDVVIVPSLVWETFSIVAREALACGAPVIAARHGALPNAIREGQNGWLFDPQSTSELALLLQTLDADRSYLARLRAGISPDDWITTAERTRRLEGILEAVCVKGVAREAMDFGQVAPSALRELVTR
jgi:glycosyltransferase involved in cell wall biosynthesis